MVSAYTNDLSECFAEDYRDARRKFLRSCNTAGATIEAFEHPATGPDSLPLYTDVALIGDRNAESVLLVNSGTHGVEGFCGSGSMVGWLSTGEHRNLPTNVCIVLVHAVNPHGFAWLRRVNEDNIDLNRNFVTHSDPYPPTPEYDALHTVLVPEVWDQAAISRIKVKLQEYVSQHGVLAMQAALCSGQYGHANGVFYGGRGPSWSNLTFRTIVERHLSHARHVAFFDFHSGLGPYGFAHLICAQPPDERLRSWYGEGLTCTSIGNAPGPRLSGTIGRALFEALPNTKVDSITVEYGTFGLEHVFLSLLADNWLHLHGDIGAPMGERIKHDIRLCFCPHENDWKELVLVRALQIIRRAILGLASIHVS